ncbi:unnamed protein product [Prunus armeniaca]
MASLMGAGALTAATLEDEAALSLRLVFLPREPLSLRRNRLSPSTVAVHPSLTPSLTSTRGSGEDGQLGIGNNEEKETCHTEWVCESGKYKPWNDGKLWKSRCNARWLPEPADRARRFRKRAAWCWAIWWRSLLGALGAPEAIRVFKF